METPYVNYDTALLLKRNGFDEECFNSFEYFSSSVTLYTGWLPEYHNHPVENSMYVIKRPKIQDGITWLVKKHNILVTPYACSLGWYFEIYDLNERDITGCKALYKIGIPSKDLVKSSFLKAAEEGLAYALKNFVKNEQ
jgi:hypothetical protein